MSYCSHDVKATFEVLQAIWPNFQRRFPHPVTLAGMLEMSTAYLPVNSTWNQYIEQCDQTYDQLLYQQTKGFRHLADNACFLLHENKYKNNLWLWDLDWSIKNIRVKKTKVNKKKRAENSISLDNTSPSQDKEDLSIEDEYPEIFNNKDNFWKKQPRRPGYPTWYSELCDKWDEVGDEEFWSCGPNSVTTGQQIGARLLNLVWEGYPLLYISGYGWGYVVPSGIDEPIEEEPSIETAHLKNYPLV